MKIKAGILLHLRSRCLKRLQCIYSACKRQSN